MELVTAYLFESINFPIKNLDVETIYGLKIHNWNEENKSGKFRFFHKFFEVNNKIYRASLRFKKGEKEEGISLDFPIPFLIHELEITIKDGRKILATVEMYRSKTKKASEYLTSGVEKDLLLLINKDLMECLKEKEIE